MPVSFATGLVRHGRRPALVAPGQPPTTYSELAGKVAAVVSRLPAEKTLVAIEAETSEHAVVTYLAALARGYAVALLPPGEHRLREAFAARFRPDVVARRIDGRWRLEDSAERVGAPLHPELAVMLLTSGSTGAEKAVRLSARAVESNAAAIAQYLELGIEDRGALTLPLHYSYGLSILNSHLAAGASLYLPAGAILDPGFVAGLRDNRVTNLSGVPYSYELLERISFRDEALPDLRTMTVAGGRLEPHLVRRYHDHLSRNAGRFFVMYGQTEATARIAYVPPALVAGNPDSIGVAIPGGELSLIDGHGRVITGPETAGELVYRGPNVMMGYAENRADLARGAEIEALRTGDLAVRGEDGLFRIVGRMKRISKIAGLRVSYDHLESVLADAGIAAAVTGDDRSVLALYVSPQAPRVVRARIAAAARLTLRHVEAVRVDALPRLPSGKVDYEAVRSRLCRHSAADDGIAAAFRDAFFPHAVEARDSFASLGGDSLRYVELAMALERRLGRCPAGWERMSVEELARLEPETGGPRTIGTDLVMRVLAALLVVVHHATLWPLPGGAAAMVVLVGYGMARFQLGALVAGDLRRFFRPLLPVLLPYYVIVAGYAFAWGEIPWASVFLVGNFGFADPVRHSMLPFLYWFVEAFAQILLIVAALFLIPPVRRLAARDPFRLGLMLVAGAVAFRFAGPELWPMGQRQIFAVWWVLPLAALGFCAALSDGRAERLVVLAAAVLLMPLFAYAGGNWVGSWTLYGLQVGVIAALLFAPRIRVPAWLAPVILPTAAASYHIYLVHRFVPELLLADFEGVLPWSVFTLLSIVGGVALGVLVSMAQRRAVRLATQVARDLRWRRLRRQVGYQAG